MRALALTETPDHVCGRYRVRAFAPALAEAGWSVEIEGFARGVARLAQIDRARGFDAVLVQRKLLPAWQLGLLRRRARFLIFDFDDAILYRDSYDPRGPHCPRRAARFRRTVRAADVVVAGNDFLADCALRMGVQADRVRVIPTCIDTDRYPSRAGGPAEGGIELAWIGSSSTLTGLESQRPTWERVGREVPGAALRLICDRFPRFDPLPVRAVAWTEAGEAEELARADAGLSWIPDDLWSRGKCGLKVLQYQAAGLPALANPAGVHPEMIRAGENGFLPATADEWVDAVRTLRDAPSLRASMGAAARRGVEAHYSVRAWASTFVGTIAGHTTPPAPKYRAASRDRAGVESTRRTSDRPRGS